MDKSFTRLLLAALAAAGLTAGDGRAQYTEPAGSILNAPPPPPAAAPAQVPKAPDASKPPAALPTNPYTQPPPLNPAPPLPPANPGLTGAYGPVGGPRLAPYTGALAVNPNCPTGQCSVPETPVVFGPCVSPLYYTSFDFLYWRRDVDNEKLLLGIQAGGITTTSVIGQNDFGYDPAVRFLYGQALTNVSACDLFLEFGFIGLHHANTGVSNQAGNGVTLFGGLFPGLFDQLNSQSVAYVSDLHGGEINLKRDFFVDRTLFLLAGFRYLRFDDRFTVDETGLVTNNNVPNLDARAVRKTQITNNLIGLQLGIDYSTNDHNSRWQFSAFGRAGLYANMIDGRIEQTLTNSQVGPVVTSISPGRTKLAGAAEGGVVGTLQLGPQLHFRAGYQFLWLGAIGNAPDQATPDLLTGAFNARLAHHHDVFFHGPFAGLEWRWGCCR